MAKKKILIIDDEKDLVNSIRATLVSRGYEINTAYDGEEGLNKIISWQPDLILLDIRMPRMDGFEVLGKMKADKKITPIPVVMITTCNTEEDRNKALTLGAKDYIIKPIQPFNLIKRVRKILQE